MDLLSIIGLVALVTAVGAVGIYLMMPEKNKF